VSTDKCRFHAVPPNHGFNFLMRHTIALNAAIERRIHSPWAILPTRLARIREAFSGLDAEGVEMLMSKFADSQGKKSKATVRGRAAFIPISGVLVQREDWLSPYLGEIGCETISRMIDSAAGRSRGR
jgi:hypothetical protein